VPKTPKVPKVTLKCHPEAQPKDLANEKEILRFAQNDSFAVTLGTLAHFSSHLFFVVFYGLAVCHTGLNDIASGPHTCESCRPFA